MQKPTALFVASIPSFTRQRRTASLRRVHPYCAKSSKPNSSRPRKSKRADAPKPQSPGFAPKQDITNQTETVPSTRDDNLSKTSNLQKPDSNGITLEHRLREEIQHPLRKPKQTLFATLTFSATLGLFFACGRFVAEKDALGSVAQNVIIDALAISIFAYLTWREYQFGRRSLNSIAGRPEPRDLCVDIPDAPKALLQPQLSKPRLSTFLKNSDILIAAGRQTDLQRYFKRCTAPEDKPEGVVLVALTVDAQGSGKEPVASQTVLATDQDTAEDWIAWLGDAVPPRRYVALFRIEKGENATLPASAYVVAVDDPLSLPTADKARRPKVVDV